MMLQQMCVYSHLRNPYHTVRKYQRKIDHLKHSIQYGFSIEQLQLTPSKQ
jgi:hypothetical protein